MRECLFATVGWTRDREGWIKQVTDNGSERSLARGLPVVVILMGGKNASKAPQEPFLLLARAAEQSLPSEGWQTQDKVDAWRPAAEVLVPLMEGKKKKDFLGPKWNVWNALLGHYAPGGKQHELLQSPPLDSNPHPDRICGIHFFSVDAVLTFEDVAVDVAVPGKGERTQAKWSCDAKFWKEQRYRKYREWAPLVFSAICECSTPFMGTIKFLNARNFETEYMRDVASTFAREPASWPGLAADWAAAAPAAAAAEKAASAAADAPAAATLRVAATQPAHRTRLVRLPQQQFPTLEAVRDEKSNGMLSSVEAMQQRLEARGLSWAKVCRSRRRWKEALRTALEASKLQQYGAKRFMADLISIYSDYYATPVKAHECRRLAEQAREEASAEEIGDAVTPWKESKPYKTTGGHNWLARSPSKVLAEAQMRAVDLHHEKKSVKDIVNVLASEGLAKMVNGRTVMEAHVRQLLEHQGYLKRERSSSTQAEVLAETGDSAASGDGTDEAEVETSEGAAEGDASTSAAREPLSPPNVPTGGSGVQPLPTPSSTSTSESVDADDTAAEATACGAEDAPEAEAAAEQETPPWVARAVKLLNEGKLTTEWVAAQVRRRATETGAIIDDGGFDYVLKGCHDRNVPMERALALQNALGLY